MHTTMSTLPREREREREREKERERAREREREREREPEITKDIYVYIDHISVKKIMYMQIHINYIFEDNYLLPCVLWRITIQ